MTNRLSKLRQKLTERDINAVLISQPKNIYYLSGFYGSAGYLLSTPQQAILATDFRYVEQAGRESPEYNIFKITGELPEWFPGLISGLALSQLGFEAEHVSFAWYQQLNEVLTKSQPHLKLTPLTGLVESLRVVKEAEEMALITQAAAIADGAYTHIRGRIEVGLTELEVAWEIEKFLRENRSQPLPFEVIVASGPNSALPHAKPSSRVIGAGEPVVMDIGARFGGYTSDLTRTLCLGNGNDTFHKLYHLVLRAQLAAIAGIRDNMTGEEADRLARAVIEQAGYGDAFGHGLGHGIGLDTHESPRLAPRSSEPLSNGMVFTVEPGIYLSGWGGVRIEDDVVLENGKARVISQAAK